MGKLMGKAGRLAGAGILALAGAGILVLSGAAAAHAQPASTTSACQKLTATEDREDTVLSTLPHQSHAALVKLLDSFGRQLTQDASTGSPALKSAVASLVTYLEAGAAAGKLDTARLTAEANAVLVVCAPKGDPATGGGSTAGIQDPALFGAGGAALLIGIVVLGLALRSRLRAGPARSLG